MKKKSTTWYEKHYEDRDRQAPKPNYTFSPTSIIRLTSSCFSWSNLARRSMAWEENFLRASWTSCLSVLVIAYTNDFKTCNMILVGVLWFVKSILNELWISIYFISMYDVKPWFKFSYFLFFSILFSPVSKYLVHNVYLLDWNRESKLRVQIQCTDFSTAFVCSKKQVLNQNIVILLMPCCISNIQSCKTGMQVISGKLQGFISYKSYNGSS